MSRRSGAREHRHATTRTVTVGIGIERHSRCILVELRVAIIVHTIAVVERGRIAIGKRVVAVTAARDVALWRRASRNWIARAKAVAVFVEPELVLGSVVHIPVAVVVPSVTLECGARVHGWITVIAIGAEAAACDVHESVLVVVFAITRTQLIVGAAIAIVVAAVAGFDAQRTHAGQRVVAVDGEQRVAIRRFACDQRSSGGTAETVLVLISIPSHGTSLFIDGLIAIVVQCVTNLHLGSMNTGIAVVAVVGFQREARRPGAGLHGLVRIAVKVSVGIAIAIHADAFIDTAVAVIVEPIADLAGARKNAGEPVIAVQATHHLATAIDVTACGVFERVTVRITST